jgi:hypothetical protein
MHERSDPWRAANGQQTPPTTSWSDERPAADALKTRVTSAISYQSSPIQAMTEVACHAGGRGFESRRSR